MTLASDSESAGYRDDARASPHKRRLITAVKLGLSVAAIVMIVRGVDLDAAWQRFTHQSLWFPALAIAILAVQVGMGGLRWHFILRGLGDTSSAASSLKLYYISVFFNTWLWGAGGDVLRAWLAHREQFRLRQAISSVVLDRVASVAAVGLLILVTAPLFVRDTHQYRLAIVLCGVAAFLLAGIAAAALLHALPINWNRFRLLRAVHLLSVATNGIFLRPSTALTVVGFAVLAQIVVALAVYVMSLGLEVNLPLVDCIILLQPVALAVALPISVGGWGVRETAMIALLGFVGIPASAALSLSVQMGLLTIIATLPGAAFWLLHREGKS